jgi:hypothetical protein
MHFEFLVEDQSSEKALQKLLPKILDVGAVTYKTHHYKGVGRIPRGLQPHTGAEKRILLDQLPRLLRGFGATFTNYPKNYQTMVVVVCDLDNKTKDDFLSELTEVLQSCSPKPLAEFYLAIEETEAWYFGDIQAIVSAYPRADKSILGKYVNDSICGTWELLADAICEGGHTALLRKGWKAVGAEKTKWAETICPNMNVEENKSPSFQSFVSGIRDHSGE